MIRTDIIYQSLPYLKDSKFSIIEMKNEMKAIQTKKNLNEAELAYLVYMWITQNIRINIDRDLYEIQEPIDAYNSREATLYGITSLFIRMCELLNIKAGLISGYYKYCEKAMIKPENYSWNYISINGTYYLIDVVMGKEKNFEELYFGTDPEIFIYFHFPNENKWQLLSKPITLEKFYSMALLDEQFFYFGFKTISPDSFEINGKERFILTYVESYNNPIIQFAILNNTFALKEIKQYEGSHGKIEINYNLQDENYLEIFIIKEDNPYSIIGYKINHSKNHFLNFKNELGKVKFFEGSKNKNIRGNKKFNIKFLPFKN